MNRIVVTGAPKNAPTKNKTPVPTCTQLWRSFTTKKPWAETIGFTVKPTAPNSRKTRPKTFAKRSASQCDSIIGLLLLRVGYAPASAGAAGRGPRDPLIGQMSPMAAFSIPGVLIPRLVESTCGGRSNGGSAIDLAEDDVERAHDRGRIREHMAQCKPLHRLQMREG